MSMYIAPSSGRLLLNRNVLVKLILGGLRLFSDVWNENAAFFKRLMKIHSNPAILYYVFFIADYFATNEVSSSSK